MFYNICQSIIIMFVSRIGCPCNKVLPKF